MKRLTVCDFFCGAGGFSEGFYQAGFQIVFGLDNWNPAIVTHHLNHRGCKVVKENILNLDTPEKIDSLVPDSDVIIGSPPCVSFSHSNKAGKADKTLGLLLMKAFLRIVAYKRSKGVCKYWIMENVGNSIKFVKDKYTWKELDLPGDGPDLIVTLKQKLLASNYGAPQDRERAICGDYIQPDKVTVKKTIRDVMNMLGNPGKPKKEYYTDILYNRTYSEISDHFYDTTIPPFHWKKAKRLKIDNGYMGKMQFPDSIDRCCRTIMATQSTSTREAIIFSKEGIDNEFRSPTIRELACLMGFPLNYQFAGSSESVKHKQIGNAVCPPLALALGKAILQKNITPEARVIKLAILNLNGRPPKDFIEKPRKVTSKYTRHVPHLKINSTRIELTNKYSNFSDKEFQWSAELHNGGGKSAQKCILPNLLLEKILNESKYFLQFSNFKKDIESHFKNSIFSAEEFQYKMCRIPQVTASKHASPDEVLNIIKASLDLHITSTSLLEIKYCENLLNKTKIPVKIVCALWALNFIIYLLH